MARHRPAPPTRFLRIHQDRGHTVLDLRGEIDILGAQEVRPYLDAATGRSGADVVISSRTGSELTEVAKRVADAGRRAVVVPADLSDLDAELDGEPETDEEGCLSCPGISVPITRKPWVRVKYFDLKGEEWEISGDGLLGRCLQHEIDHLNGKTLFESASPRERIKALKAYDEAKRAGAKPGETSASTAKVR